MHLPSNPSISQYISSAEYNEGFWAQKLKYQVFTPFQGNSLYCQYIIFSSHLLNDISLHLPGFLIDKTPPLQKVKLTWQTSCPQGSHKIPSFYQTGTYVLCNTAKYLTSENVNSQYCQISYIWQWEFPKVFLKYKDYDYTYTINTTYIHIRNYSSILRAMHCNGSFFYYTICLLFDSSACWHFSCVWEQPHSGDHAVYQHIISMSSIFPSELMDSVETLFIREPIIVPKANLP